MTIRVLLAEDHRVVREGLREILQREGMQAVGDVADGLAAVQAATRAQPDLAILDYNMPGLNGVDAGRRIMDTCPRTICILLTMYTEPHYVLGALRAGILGYVVKTQAAKELLHAIRVVRTGKLYLSPVISRLVVEAFLHKQELPSEALTVRERMVLQLIAEGKSNKGVAATLGISINTAESHRGKIMNKLEIHEVASLVRYAVRIGLILP
jgi:two-component system response regulator NreC